MNESVILNVVSLLWGSLLGLLYFGGLWLTVRRLKNLKHQALLILSSFFIRNLLVAVGFYPVVVQGWQPALYCLAGFIAVRIILSERIKTQIS